MCFYCEVYDVHGMSEAMRLFNDDMQTLSEFDDEGCDPAPRTCEQFNEVLEAKAEDSFIPRHSPLSHGFERMEMRAW